VLEPGGRLVLLKGRNAAAEVSAASARWAMKVALEPSLADPEGHVLVLDEVHERGQ
jgi:hypothetical protein